MSKHHHQNREEQINNRLHDLERFQQDNMPYQKGKSKKLEDIQRNVVVDESSIQLRAYQIYHEKGGPALDNWLEAERILRNNDSTVSSFINEGNPNT